jgi:CheY-like chemotaxis protein
MQKRPQTKILIVDDEKGILELLRKSLSKNGFSVDIDLAESSEEGIKKIHNTPYDLIITDIKMPGMSGNEFCDYVKNNVEQSIPIIAMSGTPWLLGNSNFDAVLAKPFSLRDLLGMVQQFTQVPEQQ